MDQLLDGLTLDVDHLVAAIDQRVGGNGLVPMLVREGLQACSWPGNIRELENLIERAVIISPGTRLRLDLPSDAPAEPLTPIAREQEARILTQGEQRRQMRDNLIAALSACAGRISGKEGAARLLELKPTTLRSRLESFAIDPRDYRPQPRRSRANQTPR
ncbi:hypothetical protein ACEVAQ_11045 [Ectopseudomonas khazarica]|uniref:Sigma-54 factor interaction domain-containing protein n=1 Tax=Ectopseudomonas khazarica TaxID=2502979 RepID=A0ABW7MDP7_9GAMM